MECKLIVLSDFDEIVDFITTAEKSDSKVILKRPGDISEYNGKSLLSVAILMGWTVEVFYDVNDVSMEQVAMKYRVTSRETGWSGYIMKQKLTDALMTGEKEMDGQHVTLIRFFNYFADACDHGNLEQARSIFENLKEYVRFHIEAEANLQKKYEYPFAEVHRKQHELLQKEVEHVEKELNREDVDAVSLSDYIYKTFFPLFFKHIREDDIAAANYAVACENSAVVCENSAKATIDEMVS